MKMTQMLDGRTVAEGSCDNNCRNAPMHVFYNPFTHIHFVWCDAAVSRTSTGNLPYVMYIQYLVCRLFNHEEQ